MKLENHGNQFTRILNRRVLKVETSDYGQLRLHCFKLRIVKTTGVNVIAIYIKIYNFIRILSITVSRLPDVTRSFILQTPLWSPSAATPLSTSLCLWLIILVSASFQPPLGSDQSLQRIPPDQMNPPPPLSYLSPRAESLGQSLPMTAALSTCSDHMAASPPRMRNSLDWLSPRPSSSPASSRYIFRGELS